MRMLAIVLLLSTLGAAAGERDNQENDVRRIPPPGIAVPEADRAELASGAAKLGKEIDELRAQHQGKPTASLLADIQIYHKAVDWALRYNEIFDVREIATAKNLLQIGSERARQMREGTQNWWVTRGVVLLGYVSKIDGSVQP